MRSRIGSGRGWDGDRISDGEEEEEDTMKMSLAQLWNIIGRWKCAFPHASDGCESWCFGTGFVPNTCRTRV